MNTTELLYTIAGVIVEIMILLFAFHELDRNREYRNKKYNGSVAKLVEATGSKPIIQVDVSVQIPLEPLK